jgi:RNA polymerase sigma factor, sigma-70 family
LVVEFTVPRDEGSYLGDRQRIMTVRDPAALFEHLAGAKLDEVYRLATFILGGDRAEAEDAVHDAALGAWQHFGDLRDPNRFDAWFTRIVVNSCRDHLRRQRLRPMAVADPAAVDTLDPSATVERTDALERAMLELSPDHRIIIALRYLADCSLVEIAARTGVRLGTVKSRLHFALRELRAALEADAR